MKPQDTFDIVYKVIMLLAFVYIGYELNSIKRLAIENEREINYVTSKLDYVTSDVNITKVND